MRKILLSAVFIALAIVATAQTGFNRWMPASGTNTYTTNITSFPGSYNNTVAYVKFANTNTTTATIAINGLSAQPLRKWDGDSWEPLSASDIDVNTVYKLSYNGSYYEMESFGGGSSGGGHIIEEEGTPLTQRDTLNFIGAGITAADASTRTTVTLDISGKANLSGATFAGDVEVPDESYDATAWNGSVEVPTKNAVRDKIESLTTGIVADAINDGVTTIAPSQNAVYDALASSDDLTINEQIADYTLALSDRRNTEVRMNKATAINLTVPPNGTIAFPIGTVIYVQRIGLGQLTFVQGVGVTITSTSGTLLDPGINLLMLLIKTGTNAWDLLNTSSTFPDQSANRVFAGPTTGSAAQPAFRALVSADIPSLSYWGSSGATTITTPSLTGDPYFIGNTLTAASGATLTANTRVDIRGQGTTTAKIIRAANNSNTERFTVLDDGTTTITGTLGVGIAPATTFHVSGNARVTNILQLGTSAITTIQPATNGSGSASGGGLLFTMNGNSGGAYFTFGAGTTATEGISTNFSYQGTAATKNTFSTNGTMTNPGTSGYIHRILALQDTYNFSGGTTTLTGIRYNPTLTSTTGLTHYAIVTGSGLSGFGTLTPEDDLEIQDSEGNDAALVLDADDGDDNADTWIVKSEASANDLTFTNHTTKLLDLTSDGRLYGTALHNNAGAVTGTTNQYIGSGTYTPTLFNTTNLDASTAYACQWMRVGNVVTVSGKVDMDVTAALATELGMSLPIASAMTVEQDAGGTSASAVATTTPVAVRSDAANDRVSFVFTGVSLTNDSYFFSFTYLIK